MGQGRAWLIMALQLVWPGETFWDKARERGAVGTCHPPSILAAVWSLCHLWVSHGVVIEPGECRTWLWSAVRWHPEKKISKDTHIFLKSQAEIQMQDSLGMEDKQPQIRLSIKSSWRTFHPRHTKVAKGPLEWACFVAMLLYDFN